MNQNQSLSIELRRARTRAALQRKIFRESQEVPLRDLIVGRDGGFTVFCAHDLSQPLSKPAWESLPLYLQRRHITEEACWRSARRME
jgi:hypothetical protein